MAAGLTAGASVPCLADEPELNPQDPNDRLVETPWSVMLYRGWTSTLTLADTARFEYDSANEDLYSAELAYTLAPSNPISEFFWNIRSRFQVAGNVTLRREKDLDEDIAEANLYFMVRWTKLPWNHYVPTTLAIGEGISYVSKVPSIEIETSDPGDVERLLDYLVLEATVAPPKNPRWQLVFRIHHRSGGYGTFGAENSGSNTLGIGVRYHF